jgi:hypothetical protein
MKLQLTKTAKQELKEINKRINNAGDEGYDEVCSALNERELLVADAEMYVNDAYINNSFKHLDNWCKRVGKSEFQNEYRMRVKKNIGKMLIADIITIIE